MESENISIVRRVHELFNQLEPDAEARAASPITAELLSLFDPEVEFIQPPGELDSQELEGREAFERSWRDWLDVWRTMRVDLYEVAERGDSVLALVRNTFTGRDAIEVQVDAGSVFTLADGRIVRLQAFFDASKAREAFETQGEAPG